MNHIIYTSEQRAAIQANLHNLRAHYLQQIKKQVKIKLILLAVIVVLIISLIGSWIAFSIILHRETEQLRIAMYLNENVVPLGFDNCEPEEVSAEEPYELITYHEKMLPLQSTGAFKTYMDWRTITSPSSLQHALQRLAVTDAKGFRTYKGRYLVAMGTYYADKVGKEFRVTLDSGRVFHVIVGDIKQNNHTDPHNQYVPGNGNIIEFIVDSRIISAEARNRGDISSLGFEGSIIKIEEVLYHE